VVVFASELRSPLLPGRRLSRRVRFRSASGPGPAAELGGSTAVSTTELLVARQFLSRVPALMENAERSIKVMQFVVQVKGKSAKMSSRELCIKLAAKVRDGVQVQALLNQAGGGWRAPALNRQASKWLAERGVEVRTLGSSRTCHAKLIVIDDQIAIIGSHNWTPYALERNFEVSVLIRDAACARQLARHFDELWKASQAFRG
jgi:phosphatidylserine/phosphatidylglycerophosphate/cardiolipin synthase-like enzyme